MELDLTAFVAVKPGAGWRIRQLSRESVWEQWEPLIGWAVDEWGETRPLVIVRTGRLLALAIPPADKYQIQQELDFPVQHLPESAEDAAAA
ncbi:hypothetical protein O7599_27760 [Streptomyces sp. WMMC500]|uniref:hypothetical protein n=1 Tax=Streptomyces sp. WMMC500 TaxID=3015154 RepID=UPI00248B0CA1|nr:hypothetical protein [Streptomyces sp. WMMC500]WBB59342.1 hypothetical protein O7599_27760 [Streptomyces sp. WMMC500]